MRRSFSFLFAAAILSTLLAGCASNTGIGTCGNCITDAAPVSITMTDDPPAGVNVLFFQVSLTSAIASTSSGSTVQLLPNSPIPIDVTQLQALSAFLSLSGMAPGTYTSLNLTFSNPQLVIYNQSDTSLGSSCTVGSICKLTPSFTNNSASISFTSAPFPVTVTAGTPLSLLIDFHLNTVIQPDLSVNLSAANGITIAKLPPATAAPHFGSFVGEVISVSPATGQFTVQTPWGPSVIVGVSSSTAFNNFPSSACTAPGIACVATGQIVRVHVASLVSPGSFLVTASEVDYVQPAATQTVEGTIIRILPLPTPAGVIVVQVLLHNIPAPTSSVPLGGLATVTFQSRAAYSIDNNGFTIPSGLTFAGTADVWVGQNVQLTVVPGSLSNTGSGPSSGMWGPPPSLTFTASAIELEPSQLTGSITATDSSNTSFTLGAIGPFFAPWPTAAAVTSYNVLTTGQTGFTGFNPNSYAGIAKGEFVSVNGWLFSPTGTSQQPNIVAQTVVSRPAFTF
jgi:hypothetical protein